MTRSPRGDPATPDPTLLATPANSIPEGAARAFGVVGPHYWSADELAAVYGGTGHVHHNPPVAWRRSGDVAEFCFSSVGARNHPPLSYELGHGQSAFQEFALDVDRTRVRSSQLRVESVVNSHVYPQF